LICFTEKLKELEKKSGYSKVYFFLLAVAVICSTIYVLGGAKLITDLVSFVYPAYMSFKAIDSSNSGDDTQWLTYWVVFSCVSVSEGVLGFVTEFIPFYFPMKVAFFIWLYHPKFMGASTLYAQIIKPLVMPYLNSVSSSVQKKVE